MDGGKGAQTTMRSELPPWYSSAAQGHLNRAGEVAGMDYTPYTGQRVAGLSPTTQAGIRGIHDMAYGHPLGDAAGSMVQQTLNGGYQNPFGGQGGANVSTQRNQFGTMDNPYLRTIAEQGRGDIAQSFYDATARTMARFKDRNSSSFQQALGRNEDNLARQLTQYDAQMGNAQMDRALGSEESFLGRDFAGQQFNSGLGENAANRGFQGWEAERGRQMQGVGAATGLLNTHSQNLMNAIQAGGVEQTQLQRLLDSQYGDFNEWRNYPREQLGIYGDALRATLGGAGTTQTTQGPGPDRMGQAFGGLALANMFRPGGDRK